MEIVIVEITIPEGLNSYVHEFNVAPQKSFLRWKLILKLREEQITLWDAIIPESVWSLPKELAKVDALLDDERFMQPFVEKHKTQRGRPTKAIETFLRFMYLKRRYNFGYETLVQEVGDSITWRRFWRIPIDKRMPDPITLIKAR